MSELHWVIGAGGLLGSAVVRALHARGEQTFQASKIHWETETAGSDLASCMADLIATVSANSAAGDTPWSIYWCAGATTTGSSPESLESEARTFSTFLDELHRLPGAILALGAVFLASSAGAVYGGANGAPFSEFSEPAPLGAYGRAKLTVEHRLCEFSVSTGVPVLVGRIANLYGPGQSLSKPQGLISHLCLSNLTKSPISVFVPMDTLRDYFYVDDCAELIATALARVRTEPSSCHVKVMSSGRSVSIGALLGQFRQVARNRPCVVLGQSVEASLQSRDLRLGSKYWADLDDLPKVNLADGISRTMESIRSSLLRPRIVNPSARVLTAMRTQ